MAAWIKMPLGMVLDLGPGDFVLDGDSVSPPKKGGGALLPKFSAHVHCGQTAGWMKMALGIELGLGPGYIVLCLLYTSPSPRDRQKSRMPSSA